MSNLDSKYIINLDLMQDTKNNTMHFNLSDSETSDFWINITRYTVDINEELLDKTVTLYVVKPNKNVEFGNISYDSTEKMYYCNLSSEFKNIKGNYTAQVVIYDSSTKERKVTRSKFKYYVEDDILSDASGTVKPEEQENILDDIISRLAALEEGGDGTNATASNISITDTANNFTSTSVEGALAELADDMKNVGNPTDEQVASVINEAIANGDIVAGGLTSTAQTLLISILRNAVFTSGQSESITLLQSELAKGGGSSGGDTGGDTGGGSETTQYTISNNLSNATTSNSTTSVNANASYTTTITANSGYTLNTITVTMGGTNITSSAVSGSTITISSVSGNVVITVTTTAASSSGGSIDLTNLFTVDGYYDCLLADASKKRGAGSYVGVEPILLDVSKTYTLTSIYESDEIYCGGFVPETPITSSTVNTDWGSIKSSTAVTKESIEINGTTYAKLTWTLTPKSNNPYIVFGKVNDADVSLCSLTYN